MLTSRQHSPTESRGLLDSSVPHDPLEVETVGAHGEDVRAGRGEESLASWEDENADAFTDPVKDVVNTGRVEWEEYSLDIEVLVVSRLERIGADRRDNRRELFESRHQRGTDIVGSVTETLDQGCALSEVRVSDRFRQRSRWHRRLWPVKPLSIGSPPVDAVRVEACHRKPTVLERDALFTDSEGRAANRDRCRVAGVVCSPYHLPRGIA